MVHFSSGHKYVESGKKMEEQKKKREKKRLLTGTCEKKPRIERMTGRKERMSFTYTHTLQMDTISLRLIFI
jgi:hypothetical protein